MNAKLKAYEVRDDGEGYCCVVFSTNGAAARREGASELGTDWEGIESCIRKPDLDQYSPGPIPPMTLLDHGWWFECSHCGQRVSNDDADDERTKEFNPRPNGLHSIFCSESCECADHMQRRNRQEAEAALIEVFEAKFPGAKILNVNVCEGPKLIEGVPGRFVIGFTFPGCTYGARWDFGDDFCRVSQCDADAYGAWREAAP